MFSIRGVWSEDLKGSVVSNCCLYFVIVILCCCIMITSILAIGMAVFLTIVCHLNNQNV